MLAATLNVQVTSPVSTRFVMLRAALVLVNLKEELLSTLCCALGSEQVTVHKKLTLVSFTQGATYDEREETEFG